MRFISLTDFLGICRDFELNLCLRSQTFESKLQNWFLCSAVLSLSTIGLQYNSYVKEQNYKKNIQMHKFLRKNQIIANQILGVRDPDIIHICQTFYLL